MARSWTPSQEIAMSDHGKTLLVSAAAGSGKTSVLTERIIRSLTDPEHPSDISRLLVVTFTRAAAAELKSRIASALTDALAARPGDSRLAEQLMRLGSADISTIDSFFQKTVRANFEQLGLPATFRIADKSELYPISIELMDGLIEEFYKRFEAKENDDTIFGRVNRNPFANALDHLLSNRSDGKLTPILLKYYEKFGSYPEGIALIQTSAQDLRRESEVPFLQSRYGKVLCEHMEIQFRNSISELTKIEKSLAYDPDIALKCHALLSSDMNFCRALLQSLAERDYSRVQSVLNSFVSGRFPTVKDKPREVSYYQNWRTGFRKEIMKLQENCSIPEEIICRQMIQTAEFAEMLYRLFAEYHSRFLAEKTARGVLEHNDIRAFLYRLLTEADGSASAFAESLSSKYDAVYIDEYQDVDFIQDRIFSLIGQNRRFMVGDIKQSIYGFRGSEPSIFADYRRNMPLYHDPAAEKSNGICVFMSENFRCNRSVIDFANRVCSFLFSACEKSVGYQPQDDLVCSKIGGEEHPIPVQVAVFDKSVADTDESEDELPSDEAVWVANEIERLLKFEQKDDGTKISPKDIAILTRNKAHGNAFAKELEARGISASAETARDLWHEPLMTDILNLLRAIDNPYRDIPLSEFLLSPFAAFELSELSEIRAAAPHHKSLFDAMYVYAESKADELSEKLRTYLSLLEQWRNQASVLPADRFLRLLYLDSRLVAYSTEPPLLYLYDQARSYQKISWCGLYGFLGHVEKLATGAPVGAAGFVKPSESISIMTVHHSKGLEFPVVFLCACGSRFNRSDMSESLLFHKSVGCAVKLYDASLGVSETTLLHEAVAQKIDEEQSEENIRTLYVALTRARERLYVTGTLSGKWETACSSAELVRRGNAHAILSCNSYLAQILAALSEVSSTTEDYILRHILHEEISRPDLQNQERIAAVDVAVPEMPISDPIAMRYATVVHKHATLQYELAPLNGLPTKIAASKLRPDLLDSFSDTNCDRDALDDQIELMRTSVPSFSAILNTKERVSAADIGTATHAFLEFCDYRLLLQNGVESECERLVKNGFITPLAAQILPREALEAFRTSNLMQWITNAAQLRREQKFGIFRPLSELTFDQALAQRLEGHSIFVQGSIDLLLQLPNGELYLFDYKTDRISEIERSDPTRLIKRMRTLHGNQLSCYAHAVKELFGRAPDKTFIYSLPLGTALEISIEKI